MGGFAGPRIVQKPKADFRRRSGPVIGGRAVAQFQIGLGTKQPAPGPIAEQDTFRLGAR
jgi:hypothetical protein